ncbi:MAG: D-xylose 1-dehydrogenase D-xylono,5-lactone-forming [Acidimicrobiaceae bacterium]|nr:D-xylose 1-dehydrogenase D-xylono,5-lactone-forming [Acidimicrobiaceae bacterium]
MTEPAEHVERPISVPVATGLTEDDQDRLPGPPPLAWGVIGATSQVAQLAVLPALAASPKCRLVAVGSQSRGGDEYDRHGAERAYRTYDEVLANPDVEAVYIPLPNSLHPEWTIRAAAAGKHVLCEKPLASTAAEAETMAAACAKAGVALMEAYMTPFHPRSTMLHDTLRSGRLGPLRFARTAFTGVLQRPDDHRWRPEMGGGALLDVGIYCLAPLLAAAGRLPTAVSAAATMTGSGVDSSCAGWLDFGDGFSAGFECSFDTPERQIVEVVGTDAAITVERSFTPGLPDTEITVLHRDGRREVLTSQPGEAYRGMVDHFATVIRGGDRLRRTPAQSIELLGLLDRIRVAAGMS